MIEPNGALSSVDKARRALLVSSADVLQDAVGYHDLASVALILGEAAAHVSPHPYQAISIREAFRYELFIIVEEDQFGELMRRAGQLMRNGKTVLPLSIDWVVPQRLRGVDRAQAAWETSVAANYVARCGLKGHYLEFGTYWGRSFYRSYYELRHWLDGSFVAFDSFAGLSEPASAENEFSGGDFRQGEYCCNLGTFQTIGTMLEVDETRVATVPGFFNETLNRNTAQKLGFGPNSVSLCYIDCDLKEPTRQALDFVTPYLEPGSLIYFDDWRLCRASPQVGERAAAIDWLEANSEIELVELHRDQWQHQWFIYQRNE